MDKFFDEYEKIKPVIEEMDQEIKDTVESRYEKWKNSREYLETMRDIKESYYSCTGTGITTESLEGYLPDGCLDLFVKDMGFYHHKGSILFEHPDKNKITTIGQLQSERWGKFWKTKKLKDFKSYWDSVI